MAKLNRASLKTSQRNAAAKPVRDALKERIRRCEVCLRSREPEYLACHEIANGTHRNKAISEPYAMLVVCLNPSWRLNQACHQSVQNEPEARQLARLYLCDQSRYDLVAYNALVNINAPKRIEQWEVDIEIEKLLAVGSYQRR